MKYRWASLLLLLGAFGLFLAYDPVEPSVMTRATTTDLQLGVETKGVLEAVNTSIIGPPLIPNIHRFKISMMAPEGKEVKKGTPVLGFDTSELQQKLQNRMTEVDSARKKIEQKEIDLKRRNQDDLLEIRKAESKLRRNELKIQRPSAMVPPLEQEQCRLDFELAQIEVKLLKKRIEASARASRAELANLRNHLSRATSEVQQIKDSIADMLRTAPRDGVVIYVSDWRGEKKKIGDSVWVRSTVLEIPDLSVMRARGEVEEALIGNLRRNQAVSIHLDAHPNLEFRGHISSISKSVQEKSWRNPLKIVNIDISMDSSDPEKMRPGMRFKGLVETTLLHRVLTVPLHAVFLTAQGPVVYRRRLFGFETLPLSLGRRNTERVVVKEGLMEGDRISGKKQKL